MRAEELRPRRWWYGVAVAAAVLGLAAGVASGVLAAAAAVQVSDGAGELEPRLTPLPVGVPATVELDSQGDWAVYIEAGATARVSCGGDGLTVSAAPAEVTTVQGGTTWRQAQLVRAREPGRHQLTCTSIDRTADLAFGQALDASGRTAAAERTRAQIVRAALGVLGAIVSTSLGVLAGGLLAVAVWLRRNNHRKRLLAERRY